MQRKFYVEFKKNILFCIFLPITYLKQVEIGPPQKMKTGKLKKKQM